MSWAINAGLNVFESESAEVFRFFAYLILKDDTVVQNLVALSSPSSVSSLGS
jgi:hypothetical protein